MKWMMRITKKDKTDVRTERGRRSQRGRYSDEITQITGLSLDDVKSLKESLRS